MVRMVLLSSALALAAPAAAQDAGASSSSDAVPDAGVSFTADAAPKEEQRPWAIGVSEEEQHQALELFRQGNAALKEALFARAAQLYREALEAWDHPAIHYNLALALVNLDQPIETHQHLVAALKYGAAPLDQDKFVQAERYKAVIEKQLARLEVRCDTRGATVKLDGRPIFTGPGIWEGRIRAGAHTLSATREGFLAQELSPTLAAGESKKLELRMLKAEELTEYRRKWPQWIPWAVAGAGAVVVAASTGLHLAAKGDLEAYDRGIEACTHADTGGCYPTVQLATQRTRGETLQGVAVTGYVLGGAALAAGAVLLSLNRLQPYQVSLDVKPVTLAPAPILGPGVAGASLAGTF